MPQPFMFKIKMDNSKIITAINPGKHTGRRRSDVFLDGIFAFSLDNEIIAGRSLKIGQNLSPQEITALNAEDSYQSCLDLALHFLSFRPRSESEIRERLDRHGYNIENINRVINHLKSLNLVNDVAFAEYWKTNRGAFRPRSRRIIRLELHRKGVENEVIDDAVQDVNDEENAYRTAKIKAQKLSLNDFQLFRQKLGSYLQRRGFSYGVINTIVRRIWQELTQETNPGQDINN